MAKKVAADWQLGEFGLIGSSAVTGITDEGLLTGIDSHERALTSELHNHQSEQRRLSVDRRLSAEGQRAGDAALREQTHTRLSEIDGRRAHGSASVALEAELLDARLKPPDCWDYCWGADGHPVPRVSKDDAQIVEARAAELRADLKTLPDLKRLEIALGAATSNDVGSLSAIAHQSPARPVLSPAHMELVHETYIAAHHKQEAARSRELKAYNTVQDSNTATARRIVGVQTPAPVV